MRDAIHVRQVFAEHVDRAFAGLRRLREGDGADVAVILMGQRDPAENGVYAFDGAERELRERIAASRSARETDE